MEKKFEEASKLKLRFVTSQGAIATEDLWDLSLVRLNNIAKALNKQLKEAQEEDFLDVKTAGDDVVKLSFDIVKYILDVKKAEEAARKNAVTIKAERARLMGLIAKKEDEEQSGLTKEQLLEKLASL